jgi:hypothetical protein
MESIFIVGIVFYTIYKVIEIAVLQKERRLMISRLNEVSPEMMQANLGSLQAAQNNKIRNNPFLMLRLGALALGIGFGWILGLILVQPNTGIVFNWDSERDSVFIATTAFCAGIALLIVYIIEQKAIKEAKKEK